VHGDIRVKSGAEVCGISSVVKISMGEQDQLEVAGVAAEMLERNLKLVPGIGHPGVDQEKVVLDLYQVAIYCGYIKWQR